MSTKNRVSPRVAMPSQRTATRRLSRTVAALVTAGAAIVGTQSAAMSTADAATHSATAMTTTQRMSAATLQSTQHGWYTRGSRLTLQCYARGMAVKGFYSPYIPGSWDNLWYKVSDGYWVADVDINTGSNGPVTGACTPPPASSPAAPFNAAIISRANAVPSGTYGGQCAIWVENIIRAAGGPSIALGASTSGYQAAWGRYATQVSWATARAGDVVQFYSPSYGVHTLILTSGGSPSTAQVVDSNYGFTEKVSRGSFSSRAAGFHNANYVIWRVHG